MKIYFQFLVKKYQIYIMIFYFIKLIKIIFKIILEKN